jgi:hypothetical protein
MASRPRYLDMRPRGAENHHGLDVRVRYLLLALTLAGCRAKSAAPPCEAVGTKLVTLVRLELDRAALGEDTRRLVLYQLPAMRDSLVDACKDGDWAPDVRSCLLDAVDHASFESCQRALTATQRSRLERGASDER